ncbi:MAG: hypothetical protein LBE13_23060 [Bacteroidales bacterium]|nr:hypothetical protein [Bacteroidales bacterium]
MEKTIEKARKNTRQSNKIDKFSFQLGKILDNLNLSRKEKQNEIRGSKFNLDF